jgi:hypothetical protein
MVDARVLVLFELGQLILSDIHHDYVSLVEVKSAVVGRVCVGVVVDNKEAESQVLAGQGP